MEHDLLDRWRGGDRAAGEQLFDEQFPALCRFFANKCVASDADELVQTTFVACIEARERFRGDASFRTFLFSIARNKLLQHVRARGRRPTEVVSSLEDVVTTARTQLARGESHRALLAALRQLPLDDQTLLELHYWEELDTVELARVFEAPPATIRTWLFRARAKLRELLAQSPQIEK